MLAGWPGRSSERRRVAAARRFLRYLKAAPGGADQVLTTRQAKVEQGKPLGLPAKLPEMLAGPQVRGGAGVAAAVFALFI